MRKIGIISIHGSTKEIEAAELALSTVVFPGNQEHDREIIQSLIHAEKIKASILYAGNIVWNADKLVKNVKLIIKNNEMLKMNDYLYKFLSLTCGSIAHYNKYGWINVYPTVNLLRDFFNHNEFGKPVKHHIPLWHTDARKAANTIHNILEDIK